MSNPVDDNMDDRDRLAVESSFAVRRHIFAHIDRRALLDYVAHLVDTSGFIRFERERDKKYLNPLRPTLNLIMDLDAAEESSGEQLRESEVGRERAMNVRGRLVHDTVSVKSAEIIRAILDEILTGKTVPELSEHMAKINPKGHSPEMVDIINNYRTRIYTPEGATSPVDEGIGFMLANISAVIFPPGEDGSGVLDTDTGFTLEFMY